MTSVKVTTTKSKKTSKKKAGFKISEKPYDHAMPDKFNFKTHKPLKKSNFAEEYLYFEHRVAYADYQSDLWAAKAEESKKLGSAKERRQKKAVVKLQSKMSELKAQLTKQGVDVEALLKAAAATTADKE